MELEKDNLKLELTRCRTESASFRAQMETHSQNCTALYSKLSVAQQDVVEISRMRKEEQEEYKKRLREEEVG